MFTIRDQVLTRIGPNVGRVALRLHASPLRGRASAYSTKLGGGSSNKLTKSRVYMAQAQAAAVDNVPANFGLNFQTTISSDIASSGMADESSLNIMPSMMEAWEKNLTSETWLQGPRPAEWWTGKQPLPGVCPGVNEEGVLRTLPMPNLNNLTRQSVQDYFDNTWTQYETMFAALNGETAFYRPPLHGLRHPQIFYYGHTACLYINKFRVAGLIDAPIDKYMESILETGVDEMLWDDMHRYDDPWPTVSEVHEYRQKVYKVVSNVIATHPGLGTEDAPSRVTSDDPLWALFMGFEHDRIHLETSMVAFRELPLPFVQTPKAWPPIHPLTHPVSNTVLEGSYPANPMLPLQAQSVTLGKPKDFPAFGWDNEYGSRTMEVPGFSASKHLVSNGEFWHFVADQGYHTERYWSKKGWEFKKFRNAKWPYFWERDGPAGSNQFTLRHTFSVEPMDWSLPAVTNYFEGQAYAAWKAEKEGLPEGSYRMPTEVEHHCIRPKISQIPASVDDPLADRCLVHCGHTIGESNTSGAANVNMAFASESPVNAMPASETGHHDAMGNVWEWMEDDFNGLEGFDTHYVYPDFTAPCFDGQHNMIGGGAFCSTGNEASTFARFAFRPHFLQNSGFRLVSSKAAAPVTKLNDDDQPGDTDENVYETEELVSQYLGMHYALESGASEGVDSILAHDLAPVHALRFPQRVAEKVTELRQPQLNSPDHTYRALDVGCAVGGSSFELAKHFDQVVGIDFSHAFVEASQAMQQGEKLNINVPTEALLTEKVLAVHEPTVDDAARARCHFEQGDACNMDPAKLGGQFDAVVVANLLCRVPEPLKALDSLAAVTRKDGIVLLATPFSWLKQYTPQSKWLGGYYNESGEAVASKDTLLREMEARGFAKIHEEQMPALIREHQRKYQYIVSEATAWRKL